MDYKAWMEKAKAQIAKLQPGKPFALKNLFVGADWNALPRGNRNYFGKYFKNEVQEGRVKGVSFIGKYDNNSAKYVKTEQPTNE